MGERAEHRLIVSPVLENNDQAFKSRRFHDKDDTKAGSGENEVLEAL